MNDLPQPDMYGDWKAWAKALLVKLAEPRPEPPVVLGAKGGNVALTELLAALDEAGVIEDQTT